MTNDNTDERPAVVQLADEAYEAIRAINHRSIGGAVCAAPTAYAVLGNLQALAHMLSEASTNLAGGLARSLDEYDVYDDARDPAESVAIATDHLTQSSVLARQLGRALEAAQAAINQQGYKRREE